jgi:hypothetical protein
MSERVSGGQAKPFGVDDAASCYIEEIIECTVPFDQKRRPIISIRRFSQIDVAYCTVPKDIILRFHLVEIPAWVMYCGISQVSRSRLKHLLFSVLDACSGGHSLRCPGAFLTSPECSPLSSYEPSKARSRSLNTARKAFDASLSESKIEF